MRSLSTLVKLKELKLYDNRVASLAGLQGLSSLHTLDVSSNRLNTLEVCLCHVHTHKHTHTDTHTHTHTHTRTHTHTHKHKHACLNLRVAIFCVLCLCGFRTSGQLPCSIHQQQLAVHVGGDTMTWTHKHACVISIITHFNRAFRVFSSVLCGPCFAQHSPSLKHLVPLHFFT